MKKKIIIIILILMSVFFVKPVNTYAELKKDRSDLEEWLKSKKSSDDTDYNQPQNCEGRADSLLGDPTDEDSVAWLLQKILNYIKVLGPILVIVLSSVDFISVIVKSDDDAMAKAQKKLIKRLILAAMLFFIPTIIQVLLSVFGMSASSTCGIK